MTKAEIELSNDVIADCTEFLVDAAENAVITSGLAGLAFTNEAIEFAKAQIEFEKAAQAAGGYKIDGPQFVKVV